jgi:glutathione S-transferase
MPSEPRVPLTRLVAGDNCPFCHRCLLVLSHKAIPFERIEVDLARKADFPHLLSPYGRVPVLWHGDQPVFESSVINEYLDEVFPTPPLLPKTAERRAAARFWIDFCNTRFMPAYFNLLKERDPALRAPLRIKLMECLELINSVGLVGRANAGPYWMGEEVTLVDYAFYPFFERFASVEVYRGIIIPGGHKALRSWLEAMRDNALVRNLARSRTHYVEYYARYYADRP